MVSNAHFRAIVLSVLCLISVYVYTPVTADVSVAIEEHDGTTCRTETLCVFFLDVGQGDATLIQSPTGTQVLIDGGPDSSVLRELGDVLGLRDRTIDMIVATHPDTDHVSGLVDVLDRYIVDVILRTENESDTTMWHSVESRMETEGADIIFARRGQQYDLGGGAMLEVLFPETDVSDYESNTSSIAVRLSYGGISFLFMADAPKSTEEYLVLRDGEYLKSDVLKVGHHGSRTSTAESFLAEVLPTYAIISSGKDNRYGHPHMEVTDLLFNYDVAVFNTAEEGRILVTSDGMEVDIR